MIRNRFIKFLLVGILNTIFGYSIFAFFIFLKFHYTVATLFATVLGIVFNFKTIGNLVFKNNEKALIFRFTGVYIVIYLINITLLRVLKFFALNIYIAGAVLLLPLALLSFVMNQKYVFKELKDETR